MPDPDARWHADQARALASVTLNAVREALPKLEALVVAAEGFAADLHDPAPLLDAFGQADTVLSGAVLSLGSIHEHIKMLPERADGASTPALRSTIAEA